MDERITLEIDSAAVLSYAYAHNGISVVRDVVVTNGTGGPIEDATLLVEIKSVDGTLSRPFRVPLDLLEPGTTPVPTSTLMLDPSQLADIEEQRPGNVTARLQDARGVDLGVAEEPIRVLAHNQWLANPQVLAMEALAAFVMPNHPRIAGLLLVAGLVLGTRTGSPSLEGYQTDTDNLTTDQRSDAIAMAIYDAMCDLDINYVSPPASWDEEGQKIRTPEQVLDGRQGTCLDTAVVMAAAFEQAGLAPVVVMVHAHAFAGYFRGRDADNFASRLPTVIADTETFAALVEGNRLRLVETTTVTSGPLRKPFAQAIVENREYLASNSEQFDAIVNIRTSRANSVVPLPARIRKASGEVTIVEYRPAEHGLGAPILEAITPAGQRVHDDSPARIRQWKTSLLDLSERNALISYNPSRHGIEVIVATGTLGLIEDNLHFGRRLHLTADDELTGFQREKGSRSAADLEQMTLRSSLTESGTIFAAVDTASYNAKFRTLAANARREQEESGANNLYLTLGSLLYPPTKITTAKAVLRAPLVLVSVKLVGGGRKPYHLVLDEGGSSTPNVALLEKLNNDYGLRVPDMEEPPLDAAGIDVDRMLQSMRQACLDTGLNFRVEDTASIALLKFGTFRLWKDLNDHWRLFMTNSLVKHLVEAPTEPFKDPVPQTKVDLDEVAARCPIPADGSQLRAVARAAAGQSFLLEGPPGTGKSQTIANLLATAMAEGKKILFVAEKQAALDVVKRRLVAANLGSFCLDMHSEKSKPAAIRAQLQESLNFEVEPDVHGMRAAEGRLRGAIGELQRYPNRLHERNAIGMSLWSARQQLLALGDGPVLPVPRRVVDLWDSEKREQMNESLRNLCPLADAASVGPRHPWQLATAREYNQLDRPRLAAAITVLAGFLTQNGSPEVIDLLNACGSPQVIGRVLPLLGPDIPDIHTLDTATSEVWDAQARAAAAEVVSVELLAGPVLAKFQPQILAAPLEEWAAAADRATQGMPFGRKKRVAAVVGTMGSAVRAGVTLHQDNLKTSLTDAIRLRDQVRRTYSAAAAVPGFGAVPDLLTSGARKIVADRLVRLNSAARALATAPNAALEIPALRRVLKSEEARDSARTVVDAWAGIISVLGADDSDLDAWRDERSVIDALTASIGSWRSDAAELRFKRLQHWVEWCSSLAELRTAGLEEASDALGSGAVAPADAEGAFSRGLAAAAIRERREATGLDRFLGAGHDMRIGSYVSSSGQVRSLLRDVIPAGLLAKRAFRADSLRGDAALLSRELDKQRHALGIRSLLRTYPAVVAELTPCFLMSPDSVARFLDPGAITFDLVVFDEASQIRVAEAIGAMGRARAVVVVGDEKQMPPTSIAQTSFDTELDIDPETVEGQLAMAVEDEESILNECAKVQVPTISLTWHYRSQDESLIAFSNHAYYKDRLATFPAPAVQNNPTTGLRFIRVPRGAFVRVNGGKFNRTNPNEAAAIVAEITRRLHDADESRWSIGVVTFNMQQRDLIERRLEESEDPLVQEAMQEPDPQRRIFVKNLESVQGDERDVIMFSIAFSKNDQGRVPLTWGPMTRAGGERRLNVAVTRAKRQVLIYCSFEPKELKVEDSSSTAMRHVKEYLKLAAYGTGAQINGRVRGADARDYHREEIAAALRAEGLQVTENLGLSTFRIDLAVRVPEILDQPVMAVLLDGPRWRARATVGDRDALPLDVLAKVMNWPAVERVWLPGWLDDRAGVIDHLVTVARRAAQRVVELHAQPNAVPEESPEDQAAQDIATRVDSADESELVDMQPGRSELSTRFDPIDGSESAAGYVDEEPAVVPDPSPATPAATAPPPNATNGNGRSASLEPYVRWPEHSVTAVNGASTEELTSALVEIVAAEGPMLAELAYRRYLKASGGGRLGPNVKGRLNRVLFDAVKHGELSQIDDNVVGQSCRTMYATGTEPVVLRQIGTRSLTDVPLGEINLLARDLGLRTLPRADVKRAVLKAYGRTALTRVADQYLDDAFDYRVGQLRKTSTSGARARRE